MAKLFMFGLMVGVAGAAYWYFNRSKTIDVHEYTDTARERAGEAFGTASKMASDAASRVGDQLERVTGAVRS